MRQDHATWAVRPGAVVSLPARSCQRFGHRPERGHIERRGVYRFLTLVDDFTRECLGLIFDT